MREVLIADEVRLPIDRDTDIVAARQNGRELAGFCGFPSLDQVAVSTVVSELARNIVRYASRGEIVLRLVDGGGRRGVEVLASDDGPGIADIRLAMRDGFSTSGSFGLGLPGVRRLMDEFEISSARGRGTTVTARKWAWSGWGPPELDDWLVRFARAWGGGTPRDVRATGRTRR
jgi:serine/threonine-protein kinase RsbT